MKHFGVLLLLLTSFFSFVSCDLRAPASGMESTSELATNTQSGTNTDSISEDSGTVETQYDPTEGLDGWTWYDGGLYDYHFIYRPTEEEVARIVEGMSLYEVISIIGRPHTLSPTGRPAWFGWITDQHNLYKICFKNMVEGDVYEQTVTKVSSQALVSEDEEEYFDLAQSEKPSNADFAKITEGMQLREVIKILGKPHWYTSQWLPYRDFVWSTVEGYEIRIEIDWEYSSGMKSLSLIEICDQYGYVAGGFIWTPGGILERMESEESGVTSTQAEETQSNS